MFKQFYDTTRPTDLQQTPQNNHELFGTLIKMVSLADHDIGEEEIYAYLKNEFKEHVDKHGHALEFGEAISSRWNDGGFKLQDNPVFKKLVNLIEYYADQYWLDYGLEQRFEPHISNMWSNKHDNGGVTLLHHHSRSPIVATFYLRYKEGNGTLFFENPLEYHMCHEPREIISTQYLELLQYDLVLFPGWLKHATEANRIDDERIVIGCNFDYSDRKPMNIEL